MPVSVLNGQEVPANSHYKIPCIMIWIYLEIDIWNLEFSQIIS